MTLYCTRQALAVLCALDLGQWRYASQISQRTVQDFSQVQRALRRFEKAGLLESVMEEPQEADVFVRGDYMSRRARRRFYRLTDAGVRLRDDWKARLP